MIVIAYRNCVVAVCLQLDNICGANAYNSSISCTASEVFRRYTVSLDSVNVNDEFLCSSYELRHEMDSDQHKMNLVV